MLPKTKSGNHISGQMIRSGTSPAANYGEAQGSESRPDFIHKMGICLKELRETRVWLMVIARTEMAESLHLNQPIDEVNQLISIFVKSITTAKENEKASKQG